MPDALILVLFQHAHINQSIRDCVFNNGTPNRANRLIPNRTAANVSAVLCYGAFHQPQELSVKISSDCLLLSELLLDGVCWIDLLVPRFGR